MAISNLIFNSLDALAGLLLIERREDRVPNFLEMMGYEWESSVAAKSHRLWLDESCLLN